MRVRVKQSGDFSNFRRYTASYKRLDSSIDVESYAQRGLSLLKNATPTNSGDTAGSWYYNIVRNKKGFRIDYYNSNVTDGVPVIILLQYGHATLS